MAEGLERAIANYLSTTLSLGLFNDASPANRVIYTQMEPPVITEDFDPLLDPDAGETTSDLTITVFGDGGEPGQRRFLEIHTITIQCRSEFEEVAWETQRNVFDALEEQGGVGDHPNAMSDFNGILIARINADFQPIRLGRPNRDEGDGRFVCSQSFTVRTKRFSFF